MKVGDLFSSYEELEQALELYKKTVCNEYWIRDARTLANQKKRFPDTVNKANESLKYYYIRLACVKGGRPFKSKNENSLRKCTTSKQDCEATIFIRLSHCQTALIVIQINDNHNHRSSEPYINFYSQQGFELSEKRKNNARIRANANKKVILDHDQKEGDIDYKITLKEDPYKEGTISTNRSKKKCFAECVNLLKNTYKCENIELLIDNNGTFNGLYFQDSRMIKYFEAFPEIIIVDETCCLVELRTSICVIMIETSNGLNEIVAVCLLIEHNDEALNTFMETFVKYNPCDKVKVVMSDKDKIESKVFARHFPDAKFLISLFHIFETFNRDISVKTMKITTSDVKMAKLYLQQLILAESENEYESVYLTMVKNVPDIVNQYYEKYWAPIINYCVKYLAFQNICLSNNMNNPLENMNSVLKSIIHQHSPLEEVIKHLFLYINSYRARHDVKISQMLYRHLETPLEIGSVKSLYCDLLTRFAYEIVEKQLQLSSFCEIKMIDNNTFLVIATEGLLQVTPVDCECLFWKTNQLPCRHIFKCREIISMPLFDISLCLSRWTREYAEKVLRSCENNCTNNVVMFETTNPEETQVKVTEVSLPKSLTSCEKYEIIDDQGKALAKMCSEVSTPIFHKRLDFIQNVMKMWSEGKDSELNEHFSKLFKKNVLKKSSKKQHLKKLRK